MDEFYNERFANKIVSIISKMDDDEAEMFMRFSTYDVLMADIEANRRTIDGHTARVHKSIQSDMSRALGSLVSKGADLDTKAIAALVGTVSEVRKDRTPYEELYGKPQPRGKGGRWSVSISRESHSSFNPKYTKKEKKALKKGKLVAYNAERRPGDVMVGPEFNLTGALARTGGGVSSFADKWNQPEQNPYSNERTYRRIQAGSQALMSSNDPKVKAAGVAGNFFGQYGPQAEQVVGPRLRKTAYRYRGTERTPDRQLIETTNNASRAIMRDENIRPEEFTPAMRTAASQKAAAAYLLQRLPSKQLSELQRAGGKIPPSEGVIINADGKIITQAVGYMDDHYLPFNLKNLKGLQGGHYVRSRSQGGLTTEDIYTGLVSGARSVTVVSRSGVFTVNFEDDFRGSRRYNDKAAGMVTRYAHLLDAVQSKKVAQRRLTPEERADIRDEVERENRDNDWLTSADIQDLVNERERDYLARPTLSKDELRAIDEEARRDNPGEREQKIARAALIDRAMEAKAARNYRLDGEGYKASLDALREQYPYYIASVEARTRNTTHADNPFTTEEDNGYVKPRYNRPAGAKAGYFDESINGKGKVGADQANYQNWANNPQNRRKLETQTEVAEEGGGAKAKAKEGHDKRKARAEAVVAAGNKTRADESLKELVGLYKTVKDDSDSPESKLIKSVGASEETLNAALNNSTQRAKLIDALKSVHDMVGSVDDTQAQNLHNKATGLFAAMERTSSGKEWTGSEHAESPSRPFQFKGDAYSPAASADRIRDEYKRRAMEAGVVEGLDSVSDEALRKKAAMYGYMGKAMDDADFDDVEFIKQAVSMGATPAEAERVADAVGGEHAKNIKAQMLKKSESAHRARTLRDNFYARSADWEKESKKAEDKQLQATGTMGFAGGGTKRGNLTALPSVTETKPQSKYSLMDTPDTAGGNVMALKSLANELGRQAKEAKVTDADELRSSASILKAMSDTMMDYYHSPAMKHADREGLVEMLLKHTEDLPDDLQFAVEDWMGKRDFDK